MFKTILVPLDGSKRGEKILPYVEDLGYARESRIVLLRVIEPITYTVGAEMTPFYSQELIDSECTQAKVYLDSLAEELRSKGLDVTTEIQLGVVVQLILEVAEKEKADLIAMASHGRTGLSRVFYGSVAAGILNQADRPVLLIRAVDLPQAKTDA